MRLLSVELSGFKSFAKATSLTFDDARQSGGQGLTAIIGPNGSGKSNFAEAVRWVLGEQSAKQLRGQSSQDVIFSGTEASRRAGRAAVKLVFDNEDGRFPVEGAEVEIGRSLTTGGDSDYMVNGDPVRLVDLQQMLAEAGIGAKTYTVISQGTVDRYLTATPAERRELFDEACGIKSLQIKIREAQRKLTKAQQHQQELQSILGELEPRLRVLAREARKREERARLEKEYARKQEIWLHHAWYDRQVDAEQMSVQVAQLEEAVQAAQSAPMPDEPTVKAHDVFTRCRQLIDLLLNDQILSRQALEYLRADLETLLAGKRKTPVPNDALERARELGAAQAGLEQAKATLEMLRAEILRERGSAFLERVQAGPPEENITFHEEEIRRLGDQLARLGEVDPLALKEYEETKERYEHLQGQLADVEQTMSNIMSLMAQLTKSMDERFTQQFELIQNAFVKYFVELFGAGQAKLQLLEEGIDIYAAPPGKRPRHIHLLSGGEKALTSLALLLAILEAQSPPFIVLDEVDAALDEANSERFASLLREMAEKTQCIVITHNRETMGQADVLYGVTMQQDGISKVYSVKLSEIEEVVDIEQEEPQIAV